MCSVCAAAHSHTPSSACERSGGREEHGKMGCEAVAEYKGEDEVEGLLFIFSFFLSLFIYLVVCNFNCNLFIVIMFYNSIDMYIFIFILL